MVVEGRTLEPALQLATLQGRRQKLQQWEMPPQQARRVGDRGMVISNAVSRPLAALEAIEIPGPVGAIPARVYRPRTLAGPAPLLLYFHQGGFVLGNLDWCEAFCTLLADVGRCVVVSVDYHLAPEHVFPAAHDDALAAWRWAQEEAGRFGADPERIAVAGDSAGGNLAAYLCHEAARAGVSGPIFQLLIYPWVTCREQPPSYEHFADAWPLGRPLMDWFEEHVFTKREDIDDWRVNLLHEPGFEKLPPAHIANAGFDPLCDEGRLYAEKLAAASVAVSHRCYDALPHSFTGMGVVPAALRAQEEIAAELARGLGTG